MAKGFLIPTVIDSFSTFSASMNLMNHSNDRNNSCIRLTPVVVVLFGGLWLPSSNTPPPTFVNQRPPERWIL